MLTPSGLFPLDHRECTAEVVCLSSDGWAQVTSVLCHLQAFFHAHQPFF